LHTRDGNHGLRRYRWRVTHEQAEPGERIDADSFVVDFKQRGERWYSVFGVDCPQHFASAAMKYPRRARSAPMFATRRNIALQYPIDVNHEIARYPVSRCETGPLRHSPDNEDCR
jgi:hypothetical protein